MAHRRRHRPPRDPAVGEAGILQSWWNADDKSEWRWTLEFYNHT